MDSSLSAKDEIWFLRVCHHVSKALYYPEGYAKALLRNRHPYNPRDVIFHKAGIFSFFAFLLAPLKAWIRIR